ncbi:MAG: MurR/RpiR family transcriptional regulator [Firmicutes bacterium]|nr:MurR/RpiR family transcriptional regulator [Bacillota bacterium]MCL5015634.1 MurR/RpiR family transcriptional regulator [Bacillota bacterium]
MAISGVLDRLSSTLPTLANSEARIARWILENPRQLVDLTVKDLARITGSSQAAVIRLCKSIQVSGYQSLKVSVVADIAREDRPVGSRFMEIDPTTPLSRSIQSLKRHTVMGITRTLNDMRESDIDRVVDRLKEARWIAAYGTGASAIVVKDFQQKLWRLGLPVFWSEDFHIMATIVGQLTQDDIFMAVSYSGETAEVLELTQLARKRHAFVTALTRFDRKNPLSRLADLPIYVYAYEASPRIGASSSLISSLTAMSALLFALANTLADTAETKLFDTLDAVRSHRVALPPPETPYDGV